MTNLKIKLVLVAGLMMASNAQAELAVIVNPAHNGTVTKELVRTIYLGQNQSLRPIEQAKGTSDRQDFMASVLDMNESRFKRHWSKLIFSGKARPPSTLVSAQAVLKFVAANSNSIGYVDASLVKDDSVKLALRINVEHG